MNVAVVGATGIAGQQFIPALASHPWFRVTKLAASARSAGKRYSEALTDADTGAVRWWCQEEPPEAFLQMKVEDAAEMDASEVDLVFAAIESDAAREIEPRFAKTTPVVSTASAYRTAADAPVLVAGVNPDHAEILKQQSRNRGWKGFIAPIPNCTVTGLAVTLKPILDAFGIQHVVVTSMQAVSGAGRSPGVIGLDIIDNVVPYIPGEEEKVEREGQKILGTFNGTSIDPLQVPVSATCTRVPIIDGHFEAVYVSTEKLCTAEEVREAMRAFGQSFTDLGLPSAPERLIHVTDDPFRPQPRFDRERDGGMTTTVGRIRADHVLENGIKYALVTHNTKIGAAKGAVLTAEYLLKAGFLDR